MFRARLNDYLSYYIDARGITTFGGLYDDVLMQQLLYNLTPEVKAFVVAKQPKTAEEASNFADLQSQVTRGAAVNPSQVPSLGSTQIQKRTNIPPSSQAQQMPGNRASGVNGAPNRRLACFTCGSLEHKTIACPLENRTISSVRPNYSVCVAWGAYHSTGGPCVWPTSGVYAAAQHRQMGYTAGVRGAINPQFVLPVWINGHKVQAVRDTGNMTHTFVSSRLVREEDYTGETIGCRGIFESQGVCYNVPLASVSIYAPGLGCEREIFIVVGVWDLGPNIDCLLGNQTFSTYRELKDVVKSLVPSTNSGEDGLSTGYGKFTASFGGTCQNVARNYNPKRKQIMNETDIGLSARHRADATRRDLVRQSADSDPERRQLNGPLKANNARDSRQSDTAGHETTDGGQETDNRPDVLERKHSTSDTFDAEKNRSEAE